MFLRNLVLALGFCVNIPGTDAAVAKTIHVCVGANLADFHMCNVNFTAQIKAVEYAVTQCWNSNTSTCCPDSPVECVSPVLLDNRDYYNSVVNSCDNKMTCSSLEVESFAAEPSKCDGANTTNQLNIEVDCVAPSALLTRIMPTSTTTRPTQENTNNSLSSGAVVGIIFGVLLLIVLILLIVMALWSKRMLPECMLPKESDAGENSTLPYNTMPPPPPAYTDCGAANTPQISIASVGRCCEEKIPGREIPPEFTVQYGPTPFDFSDENPQAES